MTWYPLKKGEIWTHKHTTEGRQCEDVYGANGHPEVRENRQEQTLPPQPSESALLIPQFWTSSLRKYETIN